MTILTFRVEVDFKGEKLSIADLAGKNISKDDLKVGVILPDGQEEYFYISRSKLKDTERLALRVIDNGP